MSSREVRLVKVSFGGDKIYTYRVPERIRSSDYRQGDYAIVNSNFGVNKSIGIIREKLSVNEEILEEYEIRSGITFKDILYVIPYNDLQW